MEMTECDSVRACFLQLFAHWKEGVCNSAHSKDFLLNLSLLLKLIYGQYPELIPGIHLGYIQIHQQ